MKKRYKEGNIFTDVKLERFPRHHFDKSYFNRFTCNHGLAVPFFVDEVIPGDRVDVRTFGRIQLQPLATSSMQNLRCYFRYFYVPFRLLWENWDKFMTQDSQSELAIKAPFIVLNGNQMNGMKDNVGGLGDMLGLNLFNPDPASNNPSIGKRYDGDLDKGAFLQFNLFRWAAYHLIWDTYFRDENLQEEVFEPLNDGLNSNYLSKLQQLLPIAYEKDYFTTALPWPQKGEPVNLSAQLLSSSDTPYFLVDGVSNNKYGMSIGVPMQSFLPSIEGINNGESLPVNNNYNGLRLPVLASNDGDSYANGQGLRLDTQEFVTSFNINDLRYSNALQRFLERKALGGSRPAEFYLSMYGVRVDDLRIGQPLYLGGGYSNVSITDVTQQSQNALGVDGSPLGTLAGNGKSFPAMRMNNPYYCQEFGLLMGIMYIRPEVNYSQGLDRRLQLFDTLDYYNPVFAHLGEEAVKTSELYIKPTINNLTYGSRSVNNNDETFGYQSRYAYLKHKRNEIHGDFKTSLSNWVLSVGFGSTPTLSDEFITVDQNYDIFAVDSATEHHYLVELYNNYQSESNMPNFVIPSL